MRFRRRLARGGGRVASRSAAWRRPIRARPPALRSTISIPNGRTRTAPTSPLPLSPAAGRSRNGLHDLQGHVPGDRGRHDVGREASAPGRAAAHVRFAFFSFDSEADTPERLRLYADSHGLDLGRWTLLRGDDDAVRELSAALDVPFRPNDQNGFEHAAVISLLDAKGEIVFQQRGAQASSDELLATLRGLLLAGN